MIHRIVGVFLIIVALIVAVHTVIEPLYYTSTDASPYSPQWTWINYITAVGVLIGILYALRRKRGARLEKDSPVTVGYLAANVVFYGFLFVGILFFFNWFGLFSVDRFTAVDPSAASIIWIIVDAGFPLLAGALGYSLCCGSSGGDSDDSEE
ncbi:MAG: hypothetical protein OXT69_15150 [Candidatus Poribacteria bacterium]|nr:hypothetical protein [Candidatus Poribacteria bacterium]